MIKITLIHIWQVHFIKNYVLTFNKYIYIYILVSFYTCVYVCVYNVCILYELQLVLKIIRQKWYGNRVMLNSSLFPSKKNIEKKKNTDNEIK